MKNFLIALSFIITLNSFGQDLNEYNYVVVPEKFSFLKEADQHQLNSLLKFLFEKNGFEAFIEGEEELVEKSPDRCKGLYADVLSNSGMFRTKLQVVLKDCRNRQVFQSAEGISREKDYKSSYQEALRKAFESIEALGYTYNEVVVTGTPDLKVQAEVRKEEKMAPEKSANVKDEQKDVRTTAEIKKETIRVNNNISTRETPSGLNLLRDDKSYFLQDIENGFNLLHKGTSEPFATLIRSSAGNSFIYNSITAKGIACFDIEGNLVIEVLREDGNTLETIVYRAQGQ